MPKQDKFLQKSWRLMAVTMLSEWTGLVSDSSLLCFGKRTTTTKNERGADTAAADCIFLGTRTELNAEYVLLSLLTEKEAAHCPLLCLGSRVVNCQFKMSTPARRRLMRDFKRLQVIHCEIRGRHHSDCFSFFRRTLLREWVGPLATTTSCSGTQWYSGPPIPPLRTVLSSSQSVSRWLTLAVKKANFVVFCSLHRGVPQ